MQLFDPNNPNEKKKIIAAVVLGVGAIVVLGYVFLGGGSGAPANQTQAAATPGPVRRPTVKSTGDTTIVNDPSIFQPVPVSISLPAVSEPRRNIFAYWEPPPKPSPDVRISTPSPTPPPPVMISGVSPANVYARTPADFPLQLMGDKFTPALHVVIDGRDLPSRFINAQQIATTVPASMIASAGSRQVMVRSNDGTLYSNIVTLTVTAPPQPNYNYVGLIAKRTANDVAVLQDKGTKEVVNVQRGDLVAGRFRVNSISEREIVFVDTTLKVRHTIAFQAESSPGANQSRPAVRVADEDVP